MPTYDFECQDCATEFDLQAPVGTENAQCPGCGSKRTRRRYSAPATFKFVKTPGAARQQEARNAKLHADTKAQFKARRKKAREAKTKDSGGGA